MSTINIKSLDSRNITIEKDGKQEGFIKFGGFFRTDIAITAANNSIYNFVRRAFWNDNYDLKQGNEILFGTKAMLLGKVVITNKRTGALYYLKTKSIMREKYELTDENGEMLININIKRGFLVEIKSGIMETTEIFDKIKEHFLICCTALLVIKQHNKN